jgi:hypothetical protein
MQKPVVEPPQEVHRLEPGGSGPDCSASVASCIEGVDSGVDGGKVGPEVTVKACGVTVARAAGEKLGTHPVYRLVVNVGTVLGSPPCRPSRPAAARHAVC